VGLDLFLGVEFSALRSFNATFNLLDDVQVVLHILQGNVIRKAIQQRTDLSLDLGHGRSSIAKHLRELRQ
jgi:hypothetical protein